MRNGASEISISLEYRKTELWYTPWCARYVPERVTETTKSNQNKEDTMDISEIQHAIDIHCPRRARHLCKIYAEMAGGTEEETERLYKELKDNFGLEKLK